MSLGFGNSIDLDLGQVPSTPVPVSPPSVPLHRIAEVRQQEGVSIRSAARRLGISVDQARRQEEPVSDLLLSELLDWQQALGVPLSDLVADSDSSLSEPFETRARLLRIMKTVRAIEEKATSSSLQTFVKVLKEQLVQLMPELEGVAAWNSIGKRRAPNETGRIAEQVVPVTFARDSMQ